MSLLPRTFMHFCTKCNNPFESNQENITMYGDILCDICNSFRSGDVDISEFIAKSNNEYEKNKKLNLKYVDTPVKFELRGDDLEMINNIKRHLSLNDEITYSWICYIEGEIKDKINSLK